MTDSVSRFDVRVEDYDRYRPSYPAAIIDAVLDGFAAPRLADVGAGTGQSTALLAARGARIIAVEPNDGMREALVRRLPAVTALRATAERTGLPDGSVDIVAMFQAFQWCDGEAALAEFHRILRPGGRVAVVWNVPDATHAFTRGYEELTDRHGAAELAASLPARSGTGKMFLNSALFVNARRTEVRNEQRLDREGLRGRLRSISYLPPPGPALDAALADGDALFERFAGSAASVGLVYRTLAFLAEKPEREDAEAG
ncbi:MAG: class I SAM-dependent methyltransferase [Candidatus Velthaea sp.]